MRTAVITRAEDGVFQPMLLGAQSNVSVYRLTGCVLRKIARQGTSPWVSTLAHLTADTFVFVNVPIETTNHMFLEALVGQILREDCGLASGILIDNRGIILHSGWEANPDGTSTDRYAGQAFKPAIIQGIRNVTSVSDHFFAVRRNQLLNVGGLSIVSSERMPKLLQLLTDAARRSNLHILITPDAVATRVT